METQTPEIVHYDGIHCNIAIEQYSSGVVTLKITGTDIGEFGDAPMLELSKRIADQTSVQLFIDARNVGGASIDVSGAWAKWLGDHKTQFQHISMLTGSRFIEITAEFVRRFTVLQGIMRIYTEPEPFDAAIDEALK